MKYVNTIPNGSKAMCAKSVPAMLEMSEISPLDTWE